MPDQMDINTPIIRHVVAYPEQPEAPRSIHMCLKKDNNHKYWKAGLWNQYNKNANMLLLSESVAKESLPKDTKVYSSIITIKVKGNGAILWKFEARHCVHENSMEQGK